MTDYGETQSSTTIDDDAVNKIISELSKQITDSAQKTNNHVSDSTSEMIVLQNEMNERTKAMEDLLITRKNTKNVYYLGFLTGTLGIIAGIFGNIIYLIAGAGVAFTAIVGIYEAKKHKW